MIKTTQKDLIKIFFVLLPIVIIFSLFFRWTVKHDAEVMEAAELYEECVLIEFGMTPIQVFQQTGEYPECDIVIHNIDFTE